MKLFKFRLNIFKSSRELPPGSIVIETKNNQEELPPLLRLLSENPLFKHNGGNMIIVDHYSYDRTLEIAHGFSDANPNKVVVLQKNPKETLYDMIRPFISQQYVEIISLYQIDESEQYLSPETLAKTKLLNRLSIKQQPKINTFNVLERLEEDRQVIYSHLRESVVEPLAHLQMKLTNSGGEKQELEDCVHTINKMRMRMQSLMRHFDPSHYEGNDLYQNISGLLSDFSNRTRIKATLKETGKSRALPYYLGICLMRILQEAMDNVEKHAQATDVELRMRWGIRNLHIYMQDNGVGMLKQQPYNKGIRFMGERASLVNGTLRVSSQQGRGTAIHLRIPLPAMKEVEK